MLLQRQGLGFAVAEAGDVADKLARLVGDAHFDGGEFGMVEHLRGFGTQVVALLGARYEHHAVTDAERELAVVVHQGGDGEIGQREQGTTLAYTTAIKMHLGNGHLGTSIALANLGELRSDHPCKAVVLVEEIYQFHCLNAA